MILPVTSLETAGVEVLEYKKNRSKSKSDIGRFVILFSESTRRFQVE